MSAPALNKWARLDYRNPAHWWLGSEGTACRLDFRQDIQQAYDDDPRCPKCVAYLAAVQATERLATAIDRLAAATEQGNERGDA